MELYRGADRECLSSSLDYPIATELVNVHIEGEPVFLA
jgi:hypothetical protein